MLKQECGGVPSSLNLASFQTIETRDLQTPRKYTQLSTGSTEQQCAQQGVINVFKPFMMAVSSSISALFCCIAERNF